jgi:hypothetical protein
MVTFGQLWERVELGADERDAEESEFKPLLDSGDISASMEIVRTGLDMRSGDGNSFWEDFISLCNNNSQALSELLEVPKEKIGNWPSKIQEIVDKVEKSDDQEGGKSKRSEVIPTGNEPTADQNSGETAPSDTRPI